MRKNTKQKASSRICCLSTSENQTTLSQLLHMQSCTPAQLSRKQSHSRRIKEPNIQHQRTT
uniref:Uncharacterized protein n=1 Tax=Arundo donax TaxID=35708 RepID=A0A0A8ZWF1_ARUDO